MFKCVDNVELIVTCKLTLTINAVVSGMWLLMYYCNTVLVPT